MPNGNLTTIGANKRLLAFKQGFDLREVIVDPVNPLWRQAHNAHGRIARTHTEEGATWRKRVDGGNTGGIDGCWPCAGDGNTRAQLDP